MENIKKKGRPKKEKIENLEPKKKRGRKKKEKTEEKVVKKRGRKNIITYYSTIDTKPVNCDEKNTLLKLSSNIINSEPHLIEKKENITKNNENVEENLLLKDFISSWPHKTDVCCWWCCHEFDNVPLSIPLYMDSKKMYKCFGIFCSFNCMLAYNIQYNTTSKSNIMYLHYHLTGNMNFNIIPSSERYVLKKFGGEIDIEEFRKQQKIYKILKYPMYACKTFYEETCVKEFKKNNKLNIVKNKQSISNIFST